MCGATGEVRLDGRTPDVAAVSAMADTMVPRGPDSAGVWSQGRVVLGHRRLKIIDLSEAGAQPMVDTELGLAICWNGCIYNYQDLRRELTGHGYRFFSTSDTIGATGSSTTSRACSRSRSSSGTAAGCCSAGTGSASSRSI
jgi:asparagine synthase (glutamine-hydrolysing)